MFLGLFLDVNSVPEIPSLPQDLADSFIDCNSSSSFESPTQKNTYANNFLSAIPIFPGKIRSMIQ